jgi:hypothetical protein
MKLLTSLLFMTILFQGLAQFTQFPVTLSLPFDQDTITTTEPTFVWQCNLAAIQNDPRLSLQFALVELQQDQTAAEAILSNPPLCVATGLLSTTYNYPSTMQALQKGKTYVWQVQMLFNDQPVQQSEPWKFTIADPQPPARQFITLNTVPDGSLHYFPERKTWVLLKEAYDFDNQRALVRKPNNETVAVTLEKVLAPDNEGDSGLFNETDFYYLYCNLEQVPSGQGIYTLEVRAKSGKLYSLRFTLE